MFVGVLATLLFCRHLQLVYMNSMIKTVILDPLQQNQSFRNVLKSNCSESTSLLKFILQYSCRTTSCSFPEGKPHHEYFTRNSLEVSKIPKHLTVKHLCTGTTDSKLTVGTDVHRCSCRDIHQQKLDLRHKLAYTSLLF